jgi:hypothetical protein
MCLFRSGIGAYSRRDFLPMPLSRHPHTPCSANSQLSALQFRALHPYAAIVSPCRTFLDPSPPARIPAPQQNWPAFRRQAAVSIFTRLRLLEISSPFVFPSPHTSGVSSTFLRAGFPETSEQLSLMLTSGWSSFHRTLPNALPWFPYPLSLISATVTLTLFLNFVPRSSARYAVRCGAWLQSQRIIISAIPRRSSQQL